MKAITLIVLTLFYATVQAQSASIQSLDSLKQLAKNYLLETIGEQTGKVDIEIGYLDSRLRLASCANDGLEVFLPPRTEAIRTTTVGIRCRGNQPWSIYVPVKVRLLIPTIVAKRHLPRGTVVKAEHLQLKETDANSLRQGYFNEKKPLLGKIIKHSIYAGKIIEPNNLQLPSLIKRGEIVLIVATTHGIRVTMQGIALSNGSIGETIKVKNKSNERVLQARVIGRKQVQVML